MLNLEEVGAPCRIVPHRSRRPGRLIQHQFALGGVEYAPPRFVLTPNAVDEDISFGYQQEVSLCLAPVLKIPISAFFILFDQLRSFRFSSFGYTSLKPSQSGQL